MMTPQQQYNMLGRFLERGYAYTEDRSGYEALRGIVTRQPVYLFSAEKREAALAYARSGLSLPFAHEYPREVTVCDDQGVVVLMGVRAVNAEIHYGALVVINMGDAKDAVHMAWGFFRARMIERTDKDGYPCWVADVDRQTFKGCSLYDDGRNLTPITVPALERESVKEILIRDCVNSVTTAFEELEYTFKPRVIVVSEVPKKGKDTDWSKRKDYPRVHQREVHIILDPEEIVHMRKPAGGTHRSPIPHTRRAHVRVLRAERFGANKGKVISVGETEVNVRPGERIETPQKIYHVVSVGGHRNV